MKKLILLAGIILCHDYDTPFYHPDPPVLYYRDGANGAGIAIHNETERQLYDMINQERINNESRILSPEEYVPRFRIPSYNDGHSIFEE
jgi:hypothetical protein